MVKLKLYKNNYQNFQPVTQNSIFTITDHVGGTRLKSRLVLLYWAIIVSFFYTSGWMNVHNFSVG